MKKELREVLELIQQKNFTKVREKIIKLNSVHIGEIIENLDVSEAILIFRMLPKDLVVDVFNYINNDFQEKIISSITDKEIENIIDQIYFDDMIDLLEEMPAKVVKKILQYSNVEERKLINEFLNYPESSAGSLMTIEYVDLKKTMTVKEALEHIKATGVNKETIYTCYVIDANRKLEGIISLRHLILSDYEAKIEDIMKSDVVYVNTHKDQEEVAKVFKKYDLIAVPVVDMEDRLTGIITIDDIVDVIEQENTEDFQKMAAMAPSEKEYLNTGVWKLAKNRLMWLIILMISATFTGNIIKSFENVLQSVVLLTAFIPMLMDTGGNAGSQSATLVIRSIALGEIKRKDVLKVMWKELRVSLIVGILLSIINFLRIYYIERVPLNISLTVCITLIFTVILAKVVGAILPMLAKKLNLDPAIMASPLITTVVDATSLIVYFSVAKILLGI
ncbi:magnesium transporter [Clostridium tetanomorphum DSM 665]|uniref:magnesium transporter n=1 Tax=Clostridium tetanomorphum TaxID=1553 RepID=UPI000450BAE2|nr:magnesium transporter [Clostridium tetanomorphum]KAJ52633.1 magnesium transporter [Clostridium tetanomorphum DSM 665]MBP1863226.1 magnesium transporter [Clostridium tetanomorphum]SQB92254.1 Mg2+ transporter mgtE [Clostridium tetanomorphum]